MRRTTCPLFYQATPPPLSSSKFLSSYHTASLSLLGFVSLCSTGGTRWVDQAGLEPKRFACLCLSSAGSACTPPPQLQLHLKKNRVGQARWPVRWRCSPQSLMICLWSLGPMGGSSSLTSDLHICLVVYAHTETYTSIHPMNELKYNEKFEEQSCFFKELFQHFISKEYKA